MKSVVKGIFNEGTLCYKIIINIFFLSLIVIEFAKRVFYSPYLLFSTNNNKIVISNYTGGGYGDNGKYLAEIFKKEFDVVWLVQNLEDNSIPNDIRKVKYGSRTHYKEMSTAKIWIDNVRKTEHPFKKKNQLYIQTWHGSISLKKIEKDAVKKLNIYYRHKAKKDSKMADAIVSNSKFSTDMYKRAFWFDKEILEVGSPRCDILLDNKSVNIAQKKVKEFYNLNVDDKILLYAPTFRNAKDMSVYDVDFNTLLKLREMKDYKILLRLHPNMAEKACEIKYNDRVLKATNYPDMYELLAASDILLTDYSSSMFEFGLTKRPTIIYAKDLEAYIEERGVYFKFNDLPFPVVRNNHELIKLLQNFDYVKYKNDLINFYDKLEVIENGTASLQIHEYVKAKIK